MFGRYFERRKFKPVATVGVKCQMRYLFVEGVFESAETVVLLQNELGQRKAKCQDKHFATWGPIVRWLAGGELPEIARPIP